MEKDRSWKRADYPNRPPAWLKTKLPKDPLEGWKKVRGFAETEPKAKMVVKGLKAMGAKKTKIKKSGKGFDIYYKK